MEPMTDTSARSPGSASTGGHSDDLLALFPPTSTIDDRGHLDVGGCNAGQLARTFGTPVLVVDEAGLRQQARAYRDGLAARWPRSQVTFASKAFPCTPVERILAQEGLGCDVVGFGELAIAIKAGFAPERIYLHGNAKSDRDIKASVAAGVGTVVVDCLDDIDRLERFSAGNQHVLVRVNPDIRPETNEKISTGHAGSKFGLPLADALRAMDRIAAGSRLILDGVHVHIGSQILETEPFERMVAELAKVGVFAVYDLGGGLGVAYHRGEVAPSLDDYLDAITRMAIECLPPGATILLEPGRSMVARAAITLYTVETVKTNIRTFVAVDGGMADNMEPSAYGTRFEATLAERFGDGSDVELVGRHCESGDILVPQASMKDARIGDVVAMPMTGAYSYTMWNNYNGALRPPVVLVNDGAATEVVRRESLEELTARDVHRPK
jgi:diaminopimelate decarboxylase